MTQLLNLSAGQNKGSEMALNAICVQQAVGINLLYWNDFTDWNEKKNLRTGTRKIVEYDFCPHREYLVAVSHKENHFSKLAPLLQVLWKFLHVRLDAGTLLWQLTSTMSDTGRSICTFFKTFFKNFPIFKRTQYWNSS